MEIKYLQRDEINDHQWDTCLYTAVNGRIYSYSWYLDEVCGEWDALVLGDYKAVMPLPWRKKYGISYLYQPFFCQQLGVFSNVEITTGLINSFFEAIPKKFRFIDIQVNIFSQPVIENIQVTQRANYHLPLILPYEKLVAGYNENTRRNIRKAAAVGFQLHDNPDANTIINLYIENYGAKTPELKEADYETLARLVNTCWKKGAVKTYGIYDEHNMLCAGAIFLTDTKNIYYLVGGADSHGRDNGALHMLFDGVIKKHAAQDLVLDFEGSEIEGIARFYKGFGATATHYYKTTQNRLPFWLRWMK